jgi:hypothetical protein
VDAAAVFVAPIKEDIHNLASILRGFGEVTGLCTNFQKTSVVPIHCANIDLNDILEDIQATRASFPLKYLGLPLLVWQLKWVDFQHLEDKCADKLPLWGGVIYKHGRKDCLCQIDDYLTSTYYYLTSIGGPWFPKIHQ